MNWMFALAPASVAFALVLVLVRQRWGTERLIVAAFLGALAIMGAAMALGLADSGHALFAVVIVTASATTASAYTVERVKRAATVPDPLVELLGGAGAFVGGALVGVVVAFLLVAMSVPRIG